MTDTYFAADNRARPEPGTLTHLMHDSPRRAPVTLGLLVINSAVFVIMLLAGAGLWHTSNSVQLAWGANFGPATQDGQWWRLLSAMFLHFGVVHLALNMWALWDVGRLVERLYGRPRFLLLYLASGAIGNLLSLVVQGNQAVSGGASGAIFSLYGALLVFLWRERRHVERGEFRWFFAAASAFSLFALVMGQVVPGIDNAAHIGGLLAGALLGGVLARPWTPGSPRDRLGGWLSALALASACVVLVARIPAPSYRLGEEQRARAAIRQFLSDDRRISERWDAILATGRRDAQSFDQIAGRLDTSVTADYQESFEQLSALNLDAAAPSARTLEILRKYAALRTNASQAMAEGLRTKDAVKVRQALEVARQAPSLASGAKPPSATASASVR